MHNPLACALIVWKENVIKYLAIKEIFNHLHFIYQYVIEVNKRNVFPRSIYLYLF